MKVSPLHSMEVVSYNDPAIITESEDKRQSEALEWAFREYIATRDVGLLKFRPGMQPIRFFLRPMRLRAREWVEDVMGVRQRHTRAFQVCIEKIEGLEGPDGSDWTPATTPVEWLSEKFNCLSDASLNDLEVAGLTSLVNEIGGVAYQRAYLPPFVRGKYSPVLGSPVLSERRLDATDQTKTPT